MKKLIENKIKYIDSDTIGIIINSKKFGEKICLVDKYDYPRIKMFKWHLRKKYNGFYAATQLGEEGIYLHRLIKSFPDKMMIDHINGETLNNKNENLRICNHQQNMFNSKAKHKFKGVYKYDYGYRVYIRKNNKQIFVGLFKSEKEAAIAYNNKAIELHGEYARLNDISLAD